MGNHSPLNFDERSQRYRFCLYCPLKATSAALLMTIVLIVFLVLGIGISAYDYQVSMDNRPLIGCVCLCLFMIALSCILAYGIIYLKPMAVLIFAAIVAVLAIILAVAALSLTVSLTDKHSYDDNDAEYISEEEIVSLGWLTTLEAPLGNQQSSSTTTTGVERLLVRNARWILLALCLTTFAAAIATIAACLQAFHYVKDKNLASASGRIGEHSSAHHPHIQGYHITPTSRQEI